MSAAPIERGWSHRLLRAMDAIGFEANWRAARRRVDAGQVVFAGRTGNLLVAVVQPPDDEPYRARVAARTLTRGEWSRVERELAGRTLHAAKLLSGEVPVDIEEVFADLGLSLFPGSAKDVAMECSCDHWHMPCDHLAVAWYRLAEMFDADPFAVFAWRGRDRTEFLERLIAYRTPDAPPPVGPPASPPLSTRLDTFWGVHRTGPAAGSPGRDLDVNGECRPDLLLDQARPDPPLGDRLVELLRPLYLALGSSIPDDR